MLEKLKNLLIKANQNGIPLPLIKDPKSGMASVSLTFLALSGIIVFIGLIQKHAFNADIDLTQALYWFGICSGLYFGRNFSGNGSVKSMDINNNENKENS